MDFCPEHDRSLQPGEHCAECAVDPLTAWTYLGTTEDDGNLWIPLRNPAYLPPADTNPLAEPPDPTPDKPN